MNQEGGELSIGPSDYGERQPRFPSRDESDSLSSLEGLLPGFLALLDQPGRANQASGG